MGKTFKNIHACAIGRFPVSGDKIAQWVRAHGGTVSKDVTEAVTHLITTKETFENNVEAVQKAKLLETVKIVTYDWLEDSLQSKTLKKKQRRAAKVQTRQMKAKDKSSAPGNDSSSKPKSRTGKVKALTPSNYHIYVNEGTGDTYSATIYRQLSRNNTREKFQIKVHESNDVPHIYATQAKYSRIGKSTDEFLASLDSDQNTAIAAFRDFFAAKTGKDWEHRLDGIPVPPKQDADGKQLPAHDGWFYYETGRSLISNFLRQGETQSSVAGQGAEQIAIGSSNDDHGLLTPPRGEDESVEDQA